MLLQRIKFTNKVSVLLKLEKIILKKALNYFYYHEFFLNTSLIKYHNIFINSFIIKIYFVIRCLGTNVLWV